MTNSEWNQNIYQIVAAWFDYYFPGTRTDTPGSAPFLLDNAAYMAYIQDGGLSPEELPPGVTMEQLEAAFPTIGAFLGGEYDDGAVFAMSFSQTGFSLVRDNDVIFAIAYDQLQRSYTTGEGVLQLWDWDGQEYTVEAGFHDRFLAEVLISLANFNLSLKQPEDSFDVYPADFHPKKAAFMSPETWNWEVYRIVKAWLDYYFPGDRRRGPKLLDNAGYRTLTAASLEGCRTICAMVYGDSEDGQRYSIVFDQEGCSIKYGSRRLRRFQYSNVSRTYTPDSNTLSVWDQEKQEHTFYVAPMAGFLAMILVGLANFSLNIHALNEPANPTMPEEFYPEEDQEPQEAPQPPQAEQSLLKQGRAQEQQGDESQEQGNAVEAGRAYEEAVALFRRAIAEADTAEHRRALANCCWKLGILRRNQSSLTEAADWYELAELHFLQISEQTADDRRNGAACCIALGEINTEQSNSDKGLSWFTQAESLYRQVYQETNLTSDREQLAFCCWKISDLMKTQGSLEAAADWCEQAQRHYAQVSDMTRTPEARRNLAACCWQMGNIRRDQDAPDKARFWYGQAADLYQRLADTTGAYEDQLSLQTLHELLNTPQNTQPDEASAPILEPVPDDGWEETTQADSARVAPALQRPVPYEGSAPYIFVSYAHKDAALVWPMIARMQADGFRVWYDDGITPGTEWDVNIADHICESACMVAFLSENYLASENCLDELKFARDEGIPRQPIHLESVEPPRAIRMRMGRTQAVLLYSFQDQEEFWRKLYRSEVLRNGNVRD